MVDFNAVPLGPFDQTGFGNPPGTGPLTSPDILWRSRATNELAIWKIDNGNQLTDAKYITYGSSFGSLAGQRIAVGSDWRIEETGNFNGDGFTDILWQNTITGDVALWSVGPDGTISSAAIVPIPPAPDGTIPSMVGWKVGGAGDFNRDGISDIVIRNAALDRTAIWRMSTSGTIAGGVLLNNAQGQEIRTGTTTWQINAVGDFDGDGDADIILNNSATNQFALWQMNGVVLQQGIDLGIYPPGLRVRALGDFNGDGFVDVAGRNPALDQTVLGLVTLTGVQRVGLAGTGASAWNIYGNADFNEDGAQDLLWQNRITGDVAIWTLSNGQLNQGLYVENKLPGVSEGTRANPGTPDWEIVGLGNFFASAPA
jgi:hypothetical protein